MKLSINGMILVAAFATALPFAAQAQQSSATLEEIIVTATRRDTTLQDTPLSISALTEAGLERRGVDDFSDLVSSVAGLSIRNQGPGQTRPIIRGLFGAGEPQVGVYFDETPVSGAPGTTNSAGRFSPELKPFDVARIEVIKGPQGTLYGGGSMGGTVRYILNKPDATEFAAKITAEASSVSKGDSGYQINGMLNIPLVDEQFAARIVAFKRDEPGFIDNVALGREDINDIDADGGRVALRWTPTESFAATATYHYQDQVVGGGYHINTSLGDDDPQTNVGSNEPFIDEITLINVTLENSFSWADVLYSFSAFERDSEYFFHNDFNFNPFPPLLSRQPQPQETDTHELRFTSNGDGPLDWTFGFFTESRESFVESRVSEPDANGNEPINSTVDVTDPNGMPFFFFRNAAAFLDQDAVYGEISYHFSDRWTATVGARYFDIKNGSDVTNFLGVFSTPVVPLVTQSTRGDDSGATFKFHLAYEINDDVLIYGQFSQGYRPGGANQNSSSIAITDPALGGIPESYESDSVDNIEFGIRSQWLDNRLTVNGAIFTMDWEDMQIQSRSPSGLFSFLQNAAGTEVTGIELETAAQISDNFRWTAGLAITDAELTSDGPFNRGPNVNGVRFSISGKDGDPIPNVPDWTFNTSFEFGWDATATLRGTVFLDYSYTGDSASDFNQFLLDPNLNVSTVPNPQYSDVQGDYSIVDLRIGIEAESGWGAYLFAENVFDERAITQVFIDGTFRRDPGYNFIERPRTVGLTFSKSF